VHHQETSIPIVPHVGRRWFVVVRLVWLALAVLAVVVFVAAIPARLDQLQQLSSSTQEEARITQLVSLQLSPDDARGLLQMGISVRSYAVYHVAVEVAFALACAGVGALLIWRRSDEWIALLVALSFIAAAAASPPTIRALVDAHPGWRVPVDIILAAYVATNVVIYVFPDGRFVPRWTRWTAALLIVWTMLWVVWSQTLPEQRRLRMRLAHGHGPPPVIQRRSSRRVP
jgi:hypothetical protein